MYPKQSAFVVFRLYTTCMRYPPVINLRVMYLLYFPQADLYAGAIFIEQSLNWDIYVSVVLLLTVAAVFTIAGKSHGFVKCYCLSNGEKIIF